MDANYTLDERLGEQEFFINQELNIGQTKTVLLDFYEVRPIKLTCTKLCFVMFKFMEIIEEKISY